VVEIDTIVLKCALETGGAATAVSQTFQHTSRCVLFVCSENLSLKSSLPRDSGNPLSTDTEAS
jgi:hypothetical protein